MVKEFKEGQVVFHKNLGKGIFISHDLHDGEAVVKFTDELGYDDELRVSAHLLSENEVK